MKRFTETNKWEKPWFQDLAPHLKCLWLYICDKADCAGVWEMNWKAASMFIGKTVSASDLSAFSGKVAVFGSKLVIGSFVDFQYGKLSEDCRAHIPVFRALAKYSLSIAYSKAIHSLKEKEEEEDQEKEPEKEEGDSRGRLPNPQKNGDSLFSYFWAEYPKKHDRKKCEELWTSMKCDALMDEIMEALEKVKLTPQWMDANGKYIPDPTKWLRNRRWEDDLVVRAEKPIPGTTGNNYL